MHNYLSDFSLFCQHIAVAIIKSSNKLSVRFVRKEFKNDFETYPVITTFYLSWVQPDKLMPFG